MGHNVTTQTMMFFEMLKAVVSDPTLQREQCWEKSIDIGQWRRCCIIRLACTVPHYVDKVHGGGDLEMGNSVVKL